ncbi:MAG: quinolinate synthase NadA [Candidatus Anammoxibacter sp.]
MANSIEEKILDLKKKKNAIILSHNYQRGEVQDIADFVGDSLGLSQTASKTDAEVIIFCGVHFMAETAAIICPDKKVIIPDQHAGCPMAAMVTPRELREKKKQHPGAVVVCYVNSTAEVKAEVDICCTSSNAVKVVSSIPKDKEILFVPDKSLGDYVAKQTGRNMILWEGFCPTHHRISADHIKKLKEDNPDAEIVVHPECTEDVVNLADHVASTTGILNYVRESSSSKFFIGTESGIIHRLKKENPKKQFFHVLKLADCPNMKLITLEKILWALEDLAPIVTVDKDIAAKARMAIDKMMALA